MESARAYDADARRARAERILDVAAELLQRWGYKRLTMDDVAAEAGIGKGTIYLHWKTREALFDAVLQRELRIAILKLVEAIREDPENALPHRLGRSYFITIMRRPLLRALFMRDLEMLGKLVKSDRLRAPVVEHMRLEFMSLLAKRGLVRADIPPEELAYAFRTIILGFLMTDPLIGDGQPAVERRADLLELSLQAFSTDVKPSKRALNEVAEHLLKLFGELLDYAILNLSLNMD